MAQKRPPYPTDRPSYVRWISQGIVAWDETKQHTADYHEEVLARVREYHTELEQARENYRRNIAPFDPPKLWHYPGLRMLLHGTDDLNEYNRRYGTQRRFEK